MSKNVLLDAERYSAETMELVQQLREKLVGQNRAIEYFAHVMSIFKSALRNPALPISSALFLGPTGVGKTRAVEAVAEILFGDAKAILKVDCAEFQHDIETSKIVGSPPGYKGHKSSDPILSQKKLDWCHTAENKISFVLFDEVEKASPLLWNIILSILKTGKVSLADNSIIDFSRAVVIMTSNIGASQMSKLIADSIGFAPAKSSVNPKSTDQQIYLAALSAARKKFSVDFMGQLGKIIAFRKLERPEIEQILDIELNKLQNRVTESAKVKFVFHCSDEAKELILREGFDPQYGGRHLNRAIERFLTIPLANIVGSGQIQDGDIVSVEVYNHKTEFVVIGSSVLGSGYAYAEA